MFDLHAYLQEKKEVVDTTLDRLLPPENAEPAILHTAMRYAVLSGGKRLRPALCLACAEAAARRSSARRARTAELCGPPAAAVELFHAYTLIHDDLPSMDDDDERRGKPSCHIAFGEAVAILAGDALQALAFETLANFPEPEPPSGMLVAELASVAGSRGVVGGQVDDIECSDKKVTKKLIDSIHLRKTALLFRGAARIGARIGGADERLLNAFTTYAINLGLAFQIADDVLDAKEAHDPSSTDSQELTCLSVETPESALGRATSLVEEAAAAIESLPEEASAPLVALARFAVERKQ